MKHWWARWLRYWDVRAAEHNITNMQFRESNGEQCPKREWDEAYSWLRRAREPE